jgi:hypothetical protein
VRRRRERRDTGFGGESAAACRRCLSVRTDKCILATTTHDDKPLRTTGGMGVR